jgi:hypothetical protein
MQGKHTLITEPSTETLLLTIVLSISQQSAAERTSSVSPRLLQTANCMLLCTAVLTNRTLQTYVSSNAVQGRASTLNSINFLRMLHSVEFLSIVNATDYGIMLSVNSKLTAGEPYDPHVSASLCSAMQLLYLTASILCRSCCSARTHCAVLSAVQAVQQQLVLTLYLYTAAAALLRSVTALLLTAPYVYTGHCHCSDGYA